MKKLVAVAVAVALGAFATPPRGSTRALDSPAGRAEPAPAARSGLVRADGAVIRDDDGARLWLGTTLFWGLWGYQRDRERLIRHLEWARDRKIDFVRVLASVGGDFWAERTPDPNEKDIEAFTRLAYEHGLRVQWTVFGGVELARTPAERQRTVDVVANVALRNPEKVFAIEVGNELYSTGIEPAEARALARRLQDRVKNLVAVTAPRTDSCDDQRLWYGEHVGTLVTIHHDRNLKREGGPWRPVREPWREGRFQCPGVSSVYSSNEPIGPASSVASETDPLRVVSNAATTWIAGEAAYVFHTGSGIRGVNDTRRNRPPNIWDVTDADVMLKGLNAARSVIPADVANWKKDRSGPGALSVRQLPDRKNALEGTVDGVFCAEQPGDVVCSAINIRKRTEVKVSRAMVVQVFHPLTGALLLEQSVPSGGAFVLDATVPAVIIRGR